MVKDYYKDYKEIKGAIKYPLHIFTKGFQKQASDSRKRQREVFDRVYTKLQRKHNDFKSTEKRKRETSPDNPERQKQTKRQKMPNHYTSRRGRRSSTKPLKNSKKPFKTPKSRKKKISKSIHNAPYGFKYGLTYKPAKSYDPISKSKQLVVIEANRGVQNTTLSGRQNSFATWAICSSADLVTIFNRGSVKWNNTTASYINQTTTAQPLTLYNKFMLEQALQVLKFTNQGASTCELDIYQLVARNTSETFLDPVVAWSESLQATAGPWTIDGPGESVEGKPTSAKQFNMSWRVVKKLTYSLPPGGECKSIYTVNFKRYIDTAYANKYAMIKGITHSVMTTVRGVACDTTNGFSVGTVTTTPAKVVGTSAITYKARMCSSFPAITDNLTELSSYAMNSQALYTIADASGTVVNNNTDTNFA